MAKAHYKHAVALRYSGGSREVPSVSAKGNQLYADEVVRIARRYRIPVKEQGDLAASLSKLEVDQPIPVDLFEAVAIVICELERAGRA